MEPNINKIEFIISSLRNSSQRIHVIKPKKLKPFNFNENLSPRDVSPRDERWDLMDEAANILENIYKLVNENLFKE